MAWEFWFSSSVWLSGFWLRFSPFLSATFRSRNDYSYRSPGCRKRRFKRPSDLSPSTTQNFWVLVNYDLFPFLQVQVCRSSLKLKNINIHFRLELRYFKIISFNIWKKSTQPPSPVFSLNVASIINVKKIIWSILFRSRRQRSDDRLRRNRFDDRGLGHPHHGPHRCHRHQAVRAEVADQRFREGRRRRKNFDSLNIVRRHWTLSDAFISTKVTKIMIIPHSNTIIVRMRTNMKWINEFTTIFSMPERGLIGWHYFMSNWKC